MTLLFVDGFDHYATADLAKKWSSYASMTIDATAGRRGGGAIRGSVFTSASKTLPASASWVMGCAFYYDGTTPTIFGLLDAGSLQCDVRVNSDGTIKVTRNGTSLTNGQSVLSLPSGAWSYIEWKVTIADSIAANSCKVLVNGVEWINVDSGQDTKRTANASANAVEIKGSNTPSKWDDLYICNQSGSTNNDFLGDCRVDALFPTSDGTYTNFTPSSGSDHFAMVDEASVNTTDYNDGAASGDRDSYGMSNLSALASSTVFGLQVSAALMKDDAGARSAGTMVRSGSANSDGAGQALSTSQLFVSEIYEQDPNATAAWTESTVNAMEAGVKVTA